MVLGPNCLVRVEMVDKYGRLIGSPQNFRLDRAEEKWGYLVSFVATKRPIIFTPRKYAHIGGLGELPH